MNSNILFEPYKIGDITLKNRITMASLLRCRADPQDSVPTDLYVQYYTQRASAGLIFTECTPISKTAFSFPGAGGMYTKEQVDGWKKVVEAVHAKGTPIVAQLWHAGRGGFPSLIGEQTISPSPIAIKGKPLIPIYEYGTPREMTKDDIKEVIEQFRQAAVNAKEAGFDGVELSAGNGYLVDSFIRTSSNQRTDEYGGSAENRARFCLEVIDALISVYGAERVGAKFTPVGRYQEMYDENPLETFSYLLQQLDKRGVAFIQLVEADAPASNAPQSELVAPEKQMPEVTKQLRPYFKGTLIINNGLTAETAEKAISSGVADLVSFGKDYISNPDLAERIKNGWEINKKIDFSTVIGGGEKGYTDYPFYSEVTVSST